MHNIYSYSNVFFYQYLKNNKNSAFDLT